MAELRDGRLSLDQVGVIAAHAGPGSDEHYAELAADASVNQLRTALKLEPKPPPAPDTGDDREAEPAPDPGPQASITTTADDDYTHWHIALPHAQAAVFDAALQTHHDGLIAQWKRDHGQSAAADRPPHADPRAGVHGAGGGRVER